MWMEHVFVFVFDRCCLRGCVLKHVCIGFLSGNGLDGSCGRKTMDNDAGGGRREELLLLLLLTMGFGLGETCLLEF